MVIRQTFSTLNLRLFTEESHSQLVGTEIVCSADGEYCVSAVYRNEPRFEVRNRSAMHYGALWLRVIGAPEEKLQGHYWTDRGTAGEMQLRQRQNATFHDFNSARAHYAGLPSTS